MPPVNVAGCSVSVFRKEREAMAMLGGTIRMGNCDKIKYFLLPLFDPPLDYFYVHLAQVQELDSSGLGVLVGLHMTARNRKAQLKILAPSHYIAKLLESTRLNTIINVAGGLEAEETRRRLEKPEFELAAPQPPSQN